MSIAKEFRIRFAKAIKFYGGIRKAGRAMNISASTLSRINREHTIHIDSAQDIGPRLGICACCGQPWPQPIKE